MISVLYQAHGQGLPVNSGTVDGAPVLLIGDFMLPPAEAKDLAIRILDWLMRTRA